MGSILSFITVVVYSAPREITARETTRNFTELAMEIEMAINVA
jgi:hypothetical protein